MLLSAVSVLVVAQSSSEKPEGLMNNPVYTAVTQLVSFKTCESLFADRWPASTGATKPLMM